MKIMKSGAVAKYIVIISLSTALAGCGGESSEVIEQMTVHSTPAFCIGGRPYLCENTRAVNDYIIKTASECDGAGMTAEWGTTYQVTVSKTKLPLDIADACDYEKSLISIDSEVNDPVGTRYKNGVGSTGGGIKIERIADEENWFKLSGYSKPIYCEDDICGQIMAGSNQPLPTHTEFELVLIDDERHIQLVAEEYDEI